tara:strand:- start:50 stop:304 length:255 start_codon:yes stop_codon:yes gene_type:complete
MCKLEILKKKILYRSSYRGTKEMDILLSTFVKKYINKLELIDLLELDSFLNLSDEIIYDIFFNKKIDENLSEKKIANLLIEFKI